MSSYWSEVVTVLAWTKQNTMQRAMLTVLEWPQSHATSKPINMIINMNHNRSAALERSVKNYWGLKPVLWVPNFALSFYHGSIHTAVWSVCRFSNSSMDHHRKQTNIMMKQITDKYYDETKMRTRQKRVATDTWRSLGCRTTPLEHWSKRKPIVSFFPF